MIIITGGNATVGQPRNLYRNWHQNEGGLLSVAERINTFYRQSSYFHFTFSKFNTSEVKETNSF